MFGKECLHQRVVDLINHLLIIDLCVYNLSIVPSRTSSNMTYMSGHKHERVRVRDQRGPAH